VACPHWPTPSVSARKLGSIGDSTGKRAPCWQEANGKWRKTAAEMEPCLHDCPRRSEMRSFATTESISGEITSPRRDPPRTSKIQVSAMGKGLRCPSLGERDCSSLQRRHHRKALSKKASRAVDQPGRRTVRGKRSVARCDGQTSTNIGAHGSNSCIKRRVSISCEMKQRCRSEHTTSTPERHLFGSVPGACEQIASAKREILVL